MSRSQALKREILILLCLCQYNSIISLQAEDVNTDSLTPIVLDVVVPTGLSLCENATFVCSASEPSAPLWWSRGSENISVTEVSRYQIQSQDPGVSMLHISCVDLTDIGNYTCHTNFYLKEVLFDISIPASITHSKGDRVKVGSNASLECHFSGHPVGEVTWSKDNDPSPISSNQSKTETVNTTLLTSRLHLMDVGRKDNGSYHCMASGPDGPVTGIVPLFVLDTPQVEKIDFATAVGARNIYLNWTVNSWNSPVQQYMLMHMRNGSKSWTFYQEHIGGGNTSYVVGGLEPGTEYMLRINAKNEVGLGKAITSDDYIRTLDADPEFVPEVTVNGVTLNSITISWSAPPPQVKQHIHYYQLVSMDSETTMKEAFYPADKQMNLYLFVNLESASTYRFKVAACSEYTRKCGSFSTPVNGTTMDGLSSAPDNVTLSCRYDNISRTSIVSVTWAPPQRPNGLVVRYNVYLDGTATFKNEKGVMEKVVWEPKVRHMDQHHTSVRFYDVIPPNTNYTARVSAVTRSRNEGAPGISRCAMPPTVPDREKLARFYWGKVQEQDRWLLKLVLPRVTERNGAICCYRVFLVRLGPQQTVADLPPPEEVPLYTYQQVHRGNTGGAYIAEVFESDAVKGEVFLGDGESVEPGNSSMCQQCVGLTPAPEPSPDPEPPDPSPSPSPEPASATVPPPDPEASADSEPSPSASPETNRARRSHALAPQPFDGALDRESNYTGFVEVIVFGEEHSLLPAYSGYLAVLNPGPVVMAVTLQDSPTTFLVHILVCLGLVVAFLVGVALLMHLHVKRANHRQGMVEMSLTTSFRYLCRSFRGGRHGVLVAASPPDVAPILAADLPTVFVERHKDSDYGFQHEFELLPDRFSDRTTSHSEARENAFKNRYPDIKAYDQTRVRLSSADGSDYINANFVVGYKERKKFICAQGPMDNTVTDFWRMIWEQHLELILMLTNLEEYSKTKCAKYWPDEADGTKTFGEICVRHTTQKRYSDFIVRELVMSRVNGKKEEESRTIVQYHFLVWKDFVAPEHPSGILKFVKRVNEVYSLEKGPILVHCSAGVGRTGTLVALDSLLQQLADEGQVSIFATICDLRRQRNFLVQSLKQYIFIYRALLEAAQLGDTELPLATLKAGVEKLRQRDPPSEQTRMEKQFQMATEKVDEWKSVSVGTGEENVAKNRSERVIPYDRNRVILTPMPNRDNSTYINASFIEGYDNSESFIITQDPLETTLADFWRMLSEQNISTLVMLSDLGEGSKKCLRYWPDDEVTHDHVRVKYIQSESCPYYTRRELSVTNMKTDETVLVTQYQYNGWPTVEGEVPEVTRGLMELVEVTRPGKEGTAAPAASVGPVAVHCAYGAERSSMFVALAVLVQQLRTEKRVDLLSTTIKLRSQRQGMLDTFAQFEFLHRAIVNYADLHHLAEEAT